MNLGTDNGQVVNHRLAATPQAGLPEVALERGFVENPCGKPSGGATELLDESANPELVSPPRDYPVPRVLLDPAEFIWDEDLPFWSNALDFARRLADTGDLFRSPGYGDGLLLGSKAPSVSPKLLQKGADLAPIVLDRLRIRIVKKGNTRSFIIPISQLDVMLASEVFLQEFLPVDEVLTTPRYLPNFELTRRGYSDGGPGHRFLYVGPQPRIETSTEAITAFLDVMAFASNADRSNAVAGALTVLLRDFWPGAKPALVVTSTKSHSGKDSIILFACGTTPHLSISYEYADWALQKNLVAAVRANPGTGVLIVENIRTGRGVKVISSAFLERFITDPEPVLFSTGTGNPTARKNDLVVALSSNDGVFSPDLLNRGLCIHLSAVGDVADRQSPVGNPKLDYLPAHRERIEAELRGLVERWKSAGRPLDRTVRHPFTEWAKTIGGILLANGLTDFMANYSLRRTIDDPVRQALGHLGAARPGVWQRAGEWARLAVNLGLVKALIAESDRATDSSRERGIGVVLSAHDRETFRVEGENEKLTLRLEKARRRFTSGGQPETRYRFVILQQEAIPEDPPES